jgi:hypothetical protein
MLPGCGHIPGIDTPSNTATRSPNSSAAEPHNNSRSQPTPQHSKQAASRPPSNRFRQHPVIMMSVHSVQGEFRGRRTPETTAVYSRVPEGALLTAVRATSGVATMTPKSSG